MIITFRLNYRTRPGQSLWLKYSTILVEPELRFDQVVPLRWLNELQWEVSIELHGVTRLQLEYHYQLRQDFNEVLLDEWHQPRVTSVEAATVDCLLLLDSWCSAGTQDYAFETQALRAVLPARGPFEELKAVAGANHRFRLRMAALPPGQVPCLIGSVREIGDWDVAAAIPLQETAANFWQLNLYLPADWQLEYKYGLFDLASNSAVSLELGDNRSLAPRAESGRQTTVVSDECYRREPSGLFRGAGLAIPIFALRSPLSLGVGEFADLKPLADWASEVGLKLIQILPINDTSSAHDWTDSYPYSAISVFALHPIYLRLDAWSQVMPASFSQELNATRDSLNTLPQVDYEAVMQVKTKLTRQIFDQQQHSILADARFTEFLKNHREWVVPYAVFCVKRDHFGTADFSRWAEWAVFDRAQVDQLAEPTHPLWPEIAYHIWLQSELDHQLAAAVDHLHRRGLALKGDLPIGIDRQSVDAWAAPHLFKMNAQAGAPPDAFAQKGQNWGFPTYNWEAMQQDGYGWWRSRFAQLSRYFDAYRIDHILGFFRIWQVPYDQVEGIMGHFDPALPIHLDEIRKRGIHFNHRRFCQPYIPEHSLLARFGDAVEEVKERYLEACGAGCFQLRQAFSTQRQIVDFFATEPAAAEIVQGLLDCASEVLLFEVPDSQGTLFHPRCSMQATHSYQELDSDTRSRVEQLYNDYFYHRQEDFWQARGYEKLPTMRNASPMLLCGEDLGMVPACVPGVLQELGILSLEIQRMPKTHTREFFDPQQAPYMSVVSPSTHDMPPLREWWQQDCQTSSRFASQMLGIESAAAELSGEMATRIIWQHLHSPAMWAIFPLQDLLAIDETIRHPDPQAERINIPAIMPFYWRYRMHLGLDELAAATDFNRTLARLIRTNGR